MTNILKRLEMRIPTALLERIDKYKDEQAHTTRTAAVLELLRIALDHHEKTK